jgi:hypothetical protein
MGSEFLTFQQDPSWGNLATSIGNAIRNSPKQALDQKMTVEQIVALRAKQKRDQAEFDANTAAGNTAAEALAKAEPPMSTRDVQIEQQGPVNPADPTTQPGEIFLPPTTAQEQYLDPRVAARYKAELPFFQATARAQAFKDPNNLPGVYAKGQVGLGGVPSDPQRQQQLEYLNTGRFDKTKGDNYVAVKRDGSSTTAIPVGVSTDGRYDSLGRDMWKNLPPDMVLVKAGERSITPPASDTTMKTWAIPGPDGRPLPGSLQSSVTAPSPKHVLSTPLSSAPGEMKTWVLLGPDRRPIPGSETTAAAAPNSNFVQAGQVSLAPGTDQNWIKLDDNDQPIRGSIISSATKPEGRYVKTGEAAQTPENRVGTPAARQGLMAEYASKVVADGYKLTPQEATKLAFALNEEYKLTNKLQADAKGNIVKFSGFQEQDIPQGPHRALADAVNATLAGVGGGAPAAPGAPAAAAPVNALNPPPMATQVVSAGEANQNVSTKAAAIGRAETSRRNLETQIGYVDGQAPAIPYVPNLGAAILAERNGGIVNGMAIAALDPKAPQYLAEAKNWVEAVLRLASGAAIRPEEYADYAQIFVPNRNDNRQQIDAKLKRMSDWAQITATAMNADDATKMLMNVSRGDPVFQDMAVKLRNLAQQNGNLTTRFDDPNFGKAPAPAGGPDPASVNRILGIGK